MGRKQHPLAARIKRIMQTDEDVGKIAAATPILICRALEIFLKEVCENVGSIAAEHSAKTAGPSHLKQYVVNESKMDFLKDKVALIADLKDESCSQPKKKVKLDEGGAAGTSGRSRTKGRQDTTARGASGGESATVTGVSNSGLPAPENLDVAGASDHAQQAKNTDIRAPGEHVVKEESTAADGDGLPVPELTRKQSSTSGSLRGSFAGLRKKPGFLARAFSSASSDCKGPGSKDGTQAKDTVDWSASGTCAQATEATKQEAEETKEAGKWPLAVDSKDAPAAIANSILMGQRPRAFPHGPAPEEDDYDDE